MHSKSKKKQKEKTDDSMVTGNNESNDNFDKPEIVHFRVIYKIQARSMITWIVLQSVCR